MTNQIASPVALEPVLKLTERVGRDPLLTQGSSGNSSAKLDGALWIKASGRWMADALRDHIMLPLDLDEVRACLRQGVDPSARYGSASLETAMHAVLPHRIVLHVHCVNTIAWAVRKDAAAQLEARLKGLRWQWIPYAESGLSLAHAVERAMAIAPATDVLVLGNHGLVIGADNAENLGKLLAEVGRRLAVCPRQAHPADYAVLWETSCDSHWETPDDDAVHALATDETSRRILKGGLLYPCQAIFSGDAAEELFHPIFNLEDCRRLYWDRPFLILEGVGVLTRRGMTDAELRMLSGLAQVVQRVTPAAELRYLTSREAARVSGDVAHRYRTLASK